MRTDKLEDERMKLAYQFPGGDFVALLDPAQAILFVKVVMLHWRSVTVTPLYRLTHRFLITVTSETHLIIGNECAKFWRVAGKARRRSIAARSATEEQRRQRPVRGLARRVAGSFGAAAALLVGQRSMTDILPPHALPQHQISSNAPLP